MNFTLTKPRWSSQVFGSLILFRKRCKVWELNQLTLVSLAEQLGSGLSLFTNQSFLFNSWRFAGASQRMHICENDNLNKAEIKMYGRTGRVLLTACFVLGVTY